MRLRVSALLVLLLSSIASFAQSSHGYTLHKLLSETSTDANTTQVVGTPISGRYFISGDTVIFSGDPSTTNPYDVSCSATRTIYTVPRNGGSIKPLVSPSTRVEASQPSTGTTTLCGRPFVRGTNLIYAAGYINAQNTSVSGLFMIPLAGGTSTRFLATGDQLSDGSTITLSSDFNTSMTKGVYLVDVATNVANTTKRIAYTDDQTAAPGISTIVASISCSGATFNANSAYNTVSDGTNFAQRIGKGSSIAIAAGASTVFSDCSQVVFDPTPSTGAFRLPGEPAQPAESATFKMPAPFVSALGGVRNGLVYFTASQRLADGTSYAGLFSVEIATKTVAKVFSNRDSGIPGINPSPVTCTGQTTPYAGFSSDGLVVFDRYMAFTMAQSIKDCTTNVATASGGTYLYEFQAQTLVNGIPFGSNDPANASKGAVSRIDPFPGYLSNAGYIYGVITKANFQSANTYTPTVVELYSIDLAQAVTALSLTASSTSTYASNITLTSKLTLQSTNAAITNATGVIHFYDGTTLLGDATIDNTGTATYTTNNLSVGSHTLKAVYDGDANFQGADSATSALAVSQGATTVTLTPASQRTPQGAAAQLTARVASTVGGTPSGSVTFTSGNTALGTVALSNLQAALDLSTLAPGTYNVTATYSGDTNFTTSAGTATVYVTTYPNVTGTITPTAPVYGNTVTLAINVGSATAPGTGTATVTIDQGQAQTLTLANGAVSLPLTGLSAGSHNVSFAYNGDNTYTPVSGQQTFTVAKAASALALRSSLTTVPVGTAVTLTATASSTAGTPTGTVVFLNGSTQVGAAALTAGVATLQYTPTAAGTLNITATYAGDTNFNGSSATAVSITAGNPDFTITATPASATIRAGDTATFTFTVTPSFGFNQAVSFACAGLPANARCTFSPASVTPNGSPVTSTLTVQTNVASAQNAGYTGITVAGLMLLPLLGLIKSRKKLGLLAAIAAFGILGSLSGCAGGSSTPATTTPVTPAGTSTVAVSAGITGTTRSVNVTLTIQ